MLQKSMIITVVLLCVVATFTYNEAFGDTIDFNKCSTSQNHHCMEYLPGVNLFQTQNPNWNFDLFLPDGTCNITGTMDIHGNCSVGPIMLSDKNFTNLKNNPFIGSVQNIFSTPSGPVSNYCPLAMYTLIHQDGYFYKIKNVTNLVYPDYCVKETGPNPFPVPEFPISALILVSIFSIVILLGRLVDGHWVWK